MNILAFSEERCVLCGQIIPEGRQVCADCEYRVMQGHMPQGRHVEMFSLLEKNVSLRQRILSLLGEMR